jgi:glutathione S-transferase
LLKVWGRRSSYNVQKVLWLVGELGLEHQHIPAGGDAGGLDTPEFLAMNPHGMIPVIEDDGLVVWESHTILRYLAGRHGDDRLWPADPGARSQADRWMDWAQTSLQPAFLMGVFWGFYRTPQAQRNWPAINRSIARCAELYGRLDRWLAGRDFIVGDGLSLADIATGVSLYRYFELEIERPALPHVEAWYTRLQARPAFREHVMIPFGDLYGKLDF